MNEKGSDDPTQKKEENNELEFPMGMQMNKRSHI